MVTLMIKMTQTQEIARHQQQQQEQEQEEQTPDPYLAGVLRIIDGDTIKMASIKSNIIQNVRLALVDTPERGEPGYEAATIRQIIIQVKTF
jgi:endonuclease YncB( thermonuclease family)